MADIKQQIRDALKGHTKQNPLGMGELLKLGNGAGEALDQLERFGEVSSDMVNSRMVYWPAVISPSSNPTPPRREEIPTPATPAKVQPNTEESTEKVHPNTAKQETTMSTASQHTGGRQPSKLTQTIYDKIVEHPGIRQDALIKHVLEQCPGSTEEQALKSIKNLISSSKKIRAEGRGGNRALHLTAGVSAVKTSPVAPRKRAVGKVVTGKEAKELRGDKKRSDAPKAPKKTPAPVEVDRSFAAMIDDEDHLHLVLGDSRLILNPVHVQRLRSFLQRIGSRA